MITCRLDYSKGHTLLNLMKYHGTFIENTLIKLHTGQRRVTTIQTFS